MSPDADIKLLQNLFDRFATEAPRNVERGPWLDALWSCENWRRGIRGATMLSGEDFLFLAKAVTGLHIAAMAVGLQAGQGLVGPQELGPLLDKFINDEEEMMKSTLEHWGPIAAFVPQHGKHMGICCGILFEEESTQETKVAMLTCSIANTFAVFFELGKLRPAWNVRIQ